VFNFCIYIFVFVAHLAVYVYVFSIYWHVLVYYSYATFAANFCVTLSYLPGKKGGIAACRKLWSTSKGPKNHRAGVKWACEFFITIGGVPIPKDPDPHPENEPEPR